MPSLWKRITFSVASALCLCSVVLLVGALSTERWVIGRILCKTGVDIVNASSPELEQFIGDIYYGLFQGGKTKRCGLGNRRSKIYIFPKLVQTLNGGLHMMVILFLLVAVGFALVSLSFCIYNARKVPYQSIKGHKGLYLWNFIAVMSLKLSRLEGLLAITIISSNIFKLRSLLGLLQNVMPLLALFGALGLLCFLAAVKHHRLTERVANYRENFFVLEVLEDILDWSFWLGVGSIVTHFAVCGMVAMSRIKLPKPEIKKPEEPTISALDLLY